MSVNKTIGEIALLMFGDKLYDGLDPVLAAHLQERLEAEPQLRMPLAVAAMGRAYGWSEEDQ